jgi:hypothetical protein
VLDDSKTFTRFVAPPAIVDADPGVRNDQPGQSRIDLVFSEDISQLDLSAMS